MALLQTTASVFLVESVLVLVMLPGIGHVLCHCEFNPHNSLWQRIIIFTLNRGFLIEVKSQGWLVSISLSPSLQYLAMSIIVKTSQLPHSRETEHLHRMFRFVWDFRA